MADRLADTRRFYDLLNRLEGRIGGRRMLADCNGRMNWPNRGIYFFCEAGEARSRSGAGLRVGSLNEQAERLAQAMIDRLVSVTATKENL